MATPCLWHHLWERARRLAMRRLLPPNREAGMRLQQFNYALLACNERRQQISRRRGAPHLGAKNAIQDCESS